jgi:Xaa-Pro aminopeptidase
LNVADKLESFRREGEKIQGLSFPTISGSGPNGAIVHYRVSEKSSKKLKKNSLYLVDSGAQYIDGTTDVTRTLAIGNATLEMKENFTRVLKGHIALAKAIFPEGTSGSQLDVLARSSLWERGLDYDHGTGHGVGSYLSVHEGPQRISKAPNNVELKPGMVISNEPGYYKAGKYGIRIENLVAVRKATSPLTGLNSDLDNFLCFETLTLAPIDRSLILKNLLNKEDTQWLNNYHKTVRNSLEPLVGKEIKEWLQKATEDI